jgi:hypothetical protein
MDWKRSGKGWIVVGAVIAVAALAAYRVLFYTRAVDTVAVDEGTLSEEPLCRRLVEIGQSLPESA